MNFINLKLFFRNLKRDKFISIINALGLVIGMLSALFIFEYVYYERSYDTHHENTNYIYRLAYNRYDGNEILWETANSFFPAGDWLKSNYNEVVNHSRITPKHNITITYIGENGNKVFFNEKKAYFGSASMFEVFTIPIAQGSKNGLEKPFTVAISQRAAERYFGQSDPIGKILRVDGSEDFEVCAVFKNVPSNSIIKSDFFFSMETLYHLRPNLRNDWWGNDYGTTYLQLKPGTDYKIFAAKALTRMVADNYQERLDRVNKKDKYYLQPLQDIHLTSNIEYETEPPGNGKIIAILWGFSIFLLIVSWINYINLTTARSIERGCEVGIRKINGASRRMLISQFLHEALLFKLICLLLTLLLFVILNPVFKSVANIGDFNLLHYPEFIITGLTLFLIGIAASSFYPAIVLQSYKPVAVLKGKLKNSSIGIFFRKGMVTLQFIISVVLLCGTFVAMRQANYLMEKDMGVNYHKSMVISAPRTGEAQAVLYNKLMVLKDKIIQLPQIKCFTFTSDVPGREIESWFGCYRKGFDASDANGYFQIAVDDNFIDFYEVKLLAGRTFSKGETEKKNTIIMNKKAAERAGFSNIEEAIDKIVISGKKELQIVGVVDDFHYRSIKNEPVPTVITLNDAKKKYLTLKFDEETAKNVSSIIHSLEGIFVKSFPDQPFDYYLLDDQMEVDLKPDKTFSFVFGLFSVLAIIVAIIGIVGLIIITIGQRMKEIGIRKALGAELLDVSRLLIKEVLLQVLLAIIIALPLAWYGYQNWFLKSYIHHITLNIWMFLIPVLMLYAIILLVIHSLAANAFRLKVAEVIHNE